MTREEIIKELEKHDNTLLSFPDRGPWGKSSYRGNCSGWIQAFLNWKYNVEKMAELFAGSGTGYDVCKDMNVKYVGADLNPNPVREGILNINAVTDEVPEEFLGADMFFMHPPYGAEIGIPYAGAEWGAEKVWTKENGRNKCTVIDHTDELIPTMGYDPKDYDLGRMPWDEFMKTLNKIVMKYYSAMDSGARMGILMGDVRRSGMLHSMLTDIVKPGALEQIIIKAQHNTVSERSGNTYHGNFVPLVHEYILVLKKLAPYILDFQFPKNCKLDIRDSEDASWRDVIAAVMDQLQEAYLEDIYNEIKDYKKCKNNPHYEAKVRQTLQLDKRYENVSRGKWKKIA